MNEVYGLFRNVAVEDTGSCPYKVKCVIDEV